jgi:hypothetical protein
MDILRMHNDGTRDRAGGGGLRRGAIRQVLGLMLAAMLQFMGEL